MNVNNLETFKKNSTKYEPQYGSWCAYAMGSKGNKIEVDSETFKIINRKLYLFYHTFTNTLSDWNKDKVALKVEVLKIVRIDEDGNKTVKKVLRSGDLFGQYTFDEIDEHKDVLPLSFLKSCNL